MRREGAWGHTGARWMNRGTGVVQLSVDPAGKLWGISDVTIETLPIVAAVPCFLA